METIQHFSHYHPLTLVLINQVDYNYRYCRICFENLERDSDHYGCKECNFYIHKSCAVFPHELQHPLHPKHPLLLQLHRYEECANCNSDRFEFKYKCPHCDDQFYLCPECAFLPLTKKAENHDHPLTLLKKWSSFMCDHCWKEGNGMPYFCPTCSFTVHSKCTSSPLTARPSTIQAANHDHPLTLMPSTKISLTCDTCGNESKGGFYFCVTCLFVAHPDCVLLPSILKVIRHKHPLNLIYSPPVEQSKRRVCQICVKTVDMNYWVYCCSEQDFVAHLHCATSKVEIDKTFVPNSKVEDDRDKSIDLLPYIVKKTKSEGRDRTEIHLEIKHFSHEHDLKLMTDGLGIEQKCNACIRSIFSPFYACVDECGFFLHKSCAELLRELRHSLHQHPLKLLSREKEPFQCDACLLWCNGFDYRCDECNFDLDVQCSLIPDILTHPSHEQHGQLILASSSEFKTCSSCGSHGRYNFSCVDCESTLDFKCLTRPQTLNWEKHDHPFTLRYTSEDDSGEYYCDICEEERDSEYWFYYCADCNYPAHPKCILKNHQNLKFGMRPLKYDIHQHPLTSVETTFARCSICNKVGEEDLAYECAECNFIAHIWCL